MFAPTRGFPGMADSKEPCTMLWADPCCHDNEIWANLGYFSTKSPISRLVCHIDRMCLGLPGETTRGPIFVAMATTFALGAESNRLSDCYCYISVSFTRWRSWMFSLSASQSARNQIASSSRVAYRTDEPCRSLPSSIDCMSTLLPVAKCNVSSHWTIRMKFHAMRLPLVNISLSVMVGLNMER